MAVILMMTAPRTADLLSSVERTLRIDMTMASAVRQSMISTVTKNALMMMSAKASIRALSNSPKNPSSIALRISIELHASDS